MYVAEEDLAEFFRSRDVADRAYLDPWLIHFEHDKCDAGLLPGGFVGAHKSEHMGCVEGHARPDLVPVDDNRLAFNTAFGAQTGKIRTCVGLRVALTPHAFSSQNPGQIFISLPVGTARDQDRPQISECLIQEPRRPAFLVLLDIDHVFRWRQTHAAVLTRPARCNPAPPGENLKPGFHYLPTLPVSEPLEFRRTPGSERVRRLGSEFIVRKNIPILHGNSH